MACGISGAFCCFHIYGSSIVIEVAFCCFFTDECIMLGQHVEQSRHGVGQTFENVAGVIVHGHMPIM